MITHSLKRGSAMLLIIFTVAVLSAGCGKSDGSSGKKESLADSRQDNDLQRVQRKDRIAVQTWLRQ